MKTAIAPGTGASPGPAPSPGDRRPDGPLPELLLAMTVVTGLVDAFSYLSLGHVFVANMTGNVVFLGFGLAGAGGIAVNASLVAIAAFALGAAVGGRWALPRRPHRGRLLAATAAVEAGLVVTAAVIAGTAGVKGSALPLTLVVDPPKDLRIMQEEVFGPILPVIPYDDLDTALAEVNAGERPLALYVYSKDADLAEHVLLQTTSGGACVNVCAVQGALPALGFGGVGQSGTGRHHGIEGFRADHPQRELAMRQMSAGGTVVTFEVAGGKQGAFRVMNAFQLIAVSNNLGDSKSLATHPATTTHMRIGEAELDDLLPLADRQEGAKRLGDRVQSAGRLLDGRGDLAGDLRFELLEDRPHEFTLVGVVVVQRAAAEPGSNRRRMHDVAALARR